FVPLPRTGRRSASKRTADFSAGAPLAHESDSAEHSGAMTSHAKPAGRIGTFRASRKRAWETSLRYAGGSFAERPNTQCWGTSFAAFWKTCLRNAKASRFVLWV